MAIATANDTTVTLFDIYGNILLKFESPEPIAQIKCSRIQKDSFIALMTTEQHILVYDLEFTRRKNVTAIKLKDEIYSDQYKKLFNNYKYGVKP